MITWTGEAEPGKPYWWEERAEPVELRDAPPAKCDILIIGAGYTGLSAAIAASDGGADVAVVDAGLPGDAASSRNGGMVGAHPRLSWEKLAATFSEEIADGIFAEAGPALAFARDLIEREGIDCDLKPSGRIQLAWTQTHFDNQKRLAERIRDKSKIDIEIVERAALDREIVSEQYFGGLLFPSHCGFQPRKFVDGLLASAVRRQVSVTPNCPVTALDRGQGGWIAKTPLGTVTADKVILAANGYVTGAFGWFQKRIFPVPSFLIATEPLAELDKLAPGKRMMVETRALHSYFRHSPDGRRLIFGGRASLHGIPLELAAERLRAKMLDIWPHLSGVRLSHVWTGNTGFSFNQMPHVGQEDGLHWALGYSGSGTVMAPYLGAKAAWQALGDPRGETAYSNTALRTSWLHRGGPPHFLKAADLWYRHWVDRQDDRNRRS